MISEVQKRFIENSISYFKLGQNVTIDEWIFTIETLCLFYQFIASKPDKDVQIFRIAADLECKYILNYFTYIGKNKK